MTIIDPSEVVVLMNSSDPMSLLLAETYRSAWDIPAKNVIIVKLGRGDSMDSEETMERVKTSLGGRREKYAILAFTSPTRHATIESITSALSTSLIKSFLMTTLECIKNPSMLKAVELSSSIEIEYEDDGDPAIISWWNKEASPKNVLFLGDGLCSHHG